MAESFVLFDTPHLTALVALVLLSLLMYISKNDLQMHPRAKNFIRYLLAGLLLLSQVSLDIWNITNDTWSIKFTLPLELCSITLILSIFMLLTRSRLLYILVFFAGIGGAMQALITPNLDYGYPHFRFFQFFAAHICIILSALYMTWVERYRPTWKSIGWTMIFLNVAAVVVGAVNLAAGSNYMFLMHKPSTPSMLDWLGPYPFYLLAEECIAAVIFILMYVLFFVLPRRFAGTRSSSNEKQSSL